MSSATDPFDAYIAHQSSAADLVRAAFQGSQGLQERIEVLESELSVWKLGHREALKGRERAERAVRDHHEGEPIVLALLDGDGCIFNRQFVSKGRDGGREAALALTRHISRFADETIGRSVQVICTVFYNRMGLSKILSDVGIATPDVVNAFVLGFNAAHPLFTMTDVGSQKEAADAKIRHTLTLFAKLSSCKLILAGCGFDGGYSSTLQSLETESLLDKVHVLKSYSELAYELKRLNLKTIEFEGLFESKKLVSPNQNGYTSGKDKGYASGKEGKNGGGGNTSGKETKVKESKVVVAKEPIVKPAVKFEKFEWTTPRKTAPNKDKDTTPTPATPLVKKTEKQLLEKPRPIDPNKGLSKQVPPPCNAHYLAKDGCPRGTQCKFFHSYTLTPKHLSILKIDAKKSPCFDALKGKCTSKSCYAGHVCPWGAECRYGNDCRFNAIGMHPEGMRAASSEDSYSDSDY